jgi:hypothetical protein
MTVKYTHQELNRDIEAPAGYYTPKKEVRLPYEDREVLYVLSQAVIDAACCGTADYNSVLVPGYIINWQGGTNKEGIPLTEIEPITDKSTQRKISKIIREKENITQMEFW